MKKILLSIAAGLLGAIVGLLQGLLVWVAWICGALWTAIMRGWKTRSFWLAVWLAAMLMAAFVSPAVFGNLAFWGIVIIGAIVWRSKRVSQKQPDPESAASPMGVKHNADSDA